MTRHAFFRILLSLLLLLSQQMAFAHALSHVAGVLTPADLSTSTDSATIGSALQTVAQDSELSSAIAQEKSCHQCLMFAQLAGPLGTTLRAYAAPDLRDVAPVVALAAGHWMRTVCVFHSRAPPQA